MKLVPFMMHLLNIIWGQKFFPQENNLLLVWSVISVTTMLLGWWWYLDMDTIMPLTALTTQAWVQSNEIFSPRLSQTMAASLIILIPISRGNFRILIPATLSNYCSCIGNNQSRNISVSEFIPLPPYLHSSFLTLVCISRNDSSLLPSSQSDIFIWDWMVALEFLWLVFVFTFIIADYGWTGVTHNYKPIKWIIRETILMSGYLMVNKSVVDVKIERLNLTL